MKPATRSFYQRAVEHAARRILADLDAALDFAELARDAALSPFHFHRIFRGMLGETPLQMSRRLRLERAARRLVEGEQKVTAIALEAGYDTHEAFTRAFRTHYGRSPTELRGRAEELCSGGIHLWLPALSGLHFSPEPDSDQPIHFPSGEIDMDVRIEELPAMHVAAVRHVGPYHQIGEAFTRLNAQALSAGLFGPETFVMGIYHDDPESTPENELRADAAISVAAGAELPAGLTAHEIAAGRYALYTHVGPYEGLASAWNRLMGEWLPQSGERVREAPPLEIYRNDPCRTQAAELRTDLCVPLT